MAHGYAMVTGRAQVVMVHVIVGAGNAVGGIINAARSNVPDPLHRRAQPDHRGRRCAAAATGPSTGRRSRSTRRGMVREFVKWDYELAQLRPARDGGGPRADPRPGGAARARSTSRCRARCWPSGTTPSSTPIRARAVVPGRDAAAIRARWTRRRAMLAGARNPIIITKAARPRSRRGARAGAARRDARRAGVRPVPHLPELPPGPSAPRRLRRRAAPRRRPTRSWSSSRTCRGSRAEAPAARDARSSTSAWTRSSRATRCAASPRTWRWPGTPRLTLAALADAVARRVDAARGGRAAAAVGRPSTRRRREAAAAKSRARSQADAPIDMAWALALRRRPAWTTDDRGQRVRSRRHPGTLHAARQLLRGAAVRRARLGAGRRARGQAGRARQDGDLLRGRRRLHLRRAHRRALRLARLQPARRSSWSSTTARGTR